MRSGVRKAVIERRLGGAVDRLLGYSASRLLGFSALLGVA